MAILVLNPTGGTVTTAPGIEWEDFTVPSPVDNEFTLSETEDVEIAGVAVEGAFFFGSDYVTVAGNVVTIDNGIILADQNIRIFYKKQK